MKLGKYSKNKMEIFNGIYHEGGGVSSAFNIFFFIFFGLKSIKNYSLTAKTRFAHS